ncbi:MAG: hypothetical protein QM530_06085 [Phycisphaerales bacterium]|nr:hypothetical protein [Phycisphaerales bacterium]
MQLLETPLMRTGFSEAPIVAPITIIAGITPVLSKEPFEEQHSI